METYKLILRIKNIALTPKEYIDVSKNILLELESFDSNFENFFGWGNKPESKKEFADDKSDFNEIVFGQIKNEKIAYYNDNTNDKDIHWDSKSWLSYSNSYSNTTNVEDGQITISFTMGSNKDKLGNFLISFPKCNYPKFSDYEYVQKLFKKCLSLFDVEYGVVISNEFRRKVKTKDYKFWIGWMTYIKGAGILSELCDIQLYQKEHLDKGAFFTLSQNIPFSNDVEIIEKAIEVRDKLAVKGYLNHHI